MVVVVVGSGRIKLAVEWLTWWRVHRKRRCGGRRRRFFLDTVVNQIAKRRIEAMVGQRMPPDAAASLVLFEVRRRVIGSIPEYAANG